MDNFEFDLLDNFKGYNSSRDKTNIADGFLVRGSKNVYKKLSGNIANRFGLKRRGAVDATEAGIKSSYEWKTSTGNTLPLRVIGATSAGSDARLQVESKISDGENPIWYDLLITSTLLNPALTYDRFVFDTWWEQLEFKDRLLFVRGSNDILHWSGGITKIASATATTITKYDTAKTWIQDGFATLLSAEKKIIINSVEYTYTGGEDTETLTGVTPDPSSIVSGSIAIQSVMIQASLDPTDPITNFQPDFIRVLENQLFLGSYSARIIYISANETIATVLGFTNLTDSGTHVTGDPGFVIIDNPPNGMIQKDGKMYVSAGLSDWYILTPNTALPVSYGSPAQYVITKVDKLPGTNLSGALAHEFIDIRGNNIIYLAQDHQVRSIGIFKNVFEIKFPSLSQDIQDELKDEDFTGGALRSIGDFLYITAPNSGRDYLYQSRESVDIDGNISAERLWHAPHVRSISRFAVIDGIVYGHSTANPQLYQIWDTGQYSDDSPTGESLSYTSVARFGYKHIVSKNGVRRQGKLSGNKFFAEGYMANGTNLYCNLYFDYQGSSGIQNVILNSSTNSARFYTGRISASLGDSSLGDNPLGDGLTPESNQQEMLQKFRKIADLTPVDCFEYAFEIYSIDEDSRWEILATGMNAKLSTIQAVELNKTN